MITVTRIIFLSITLLVLTACSVWQTNGQIGYSVLVCCPENNARYSSYTLNADDVPGFMREYVAAEFSRALDEKGLIQQTGNADLAISLTYQHINLDNEQAPIDPLTPNESLQVELHYNATILVEMRETPSNIIVWSGKINRVHRVNPGEYMHQEKAEGEFLLAFRALLKNYPAR